MNLIDTKPITIAMDRSLFGPQGRRWIERKLPAIASDLNFIFVSGFSTCLLTYYICQDFQKNGLFYGLSCLPKHCAMAVIIHFMSRLLRWHIGLVVQNAAVPSDIPNISQWAQAALVSNYNSNENRGESVDFDVPLPWVQGTLVGEEAGINPRGASPERRSSIPLPFDSLPLRSPNTGESQSEGSRVIPSDSGGGPIGDTSKVEVERSETAEDARGETQSQGRHIGAQPLEPIRRREVSRDLYFTSERKSEIVGSDVFIYLVDEDGWVFVEDKTYKPTGEGWLIGWAIRSISGGYEVSVKHKNEVGPENAIRMLFQAEEGSSAEKIRFRSRKTDTLLFMVGFKKPLALVAWDRVTTLTHTYICQSHHSQSFSVLKR